MMRSHDSTTAPTSSSASRPPGAAPLDGALTEWTALASVPSGLLVDGEWRHATGARALSVEDPATGRELLRVPDATAAECREALSAAARAFESWATEPPRRRSEVLARAADLMRADGERVALVLSGETGKPIGEARDEVAFAVEYLEWNAEEALQDLMRAEADDDGSFLVSRRPVGPCLVITPWNFPLAIPARSIAPALAAGCTVVHRASDLAPLSSLALADVLTRAGLPAGCLNVVVASEPAATDELLDDPRLRKLTFTGSNRVGVHLLARCAARALRVTAELGGNAPFIVFADCHLDRALDAAVAAKCRNGGQACTSANRFYVERSLVERFAAGLAERMAALSVGGGREPGAELGPMITAAAAERLAGLVDDAVVRGARTVLAGGPLEGPGHFFAPVVLTDVPDDARVMREEIFGPVAPIAPFDDEAEAVARANATDMGLAAYVMSGDVGRAIRVAERLEAGMVGVNRGRVSAANAPFGGLKGSGFGRSGGREGMGEYLDVTYMALPDVAR